MDSPLKLAFVWGPMVWEWKTKGLVTLFGLYFCLILGLSFGIGAFELLTEKM